MSYEATQFEDLLREALVPVEPPADLARRVEDTLVNLTELAADELESWELMSIRDPRNWARPAAAAVVGSTAGAALVLVRVRGRNKRRRSESTGRRDLLERTLRDLVTEARKVLDDGDRPG